MKWIKSTGRFSSGNDLVCAGVTVGSVFYDSLRAKDSLLMYRATFLLSIPTRGAAFTTEAEAMKSVERMAQSFIRKLASDVEMEAK